MEAWHPAKHDAAWLESVLRDEADRRAAKATKPPLPMRASAVLGTWLRWAFTRHYRRGRSWEPEALCGKVGGRFADRPQHVTCPRCVERLKRGGIL